MFSTPKIVDHYHIYRSFYADHILSESGWTHDIVEKV